MGSTLLVSLWAQSLVLCPIEQIMKSILQITVIRVRTEEYPLYADMEEEKKKKDAGLAACQAHCIINGTWTRP